LAARGTARVRRVYDRAQTPYQRLGASGILSPATRVDLEALYQRLNPLRLRRELDTELDRLWALAAPDPHRLSPIETATPSAPSSLRSAPTTAPVTLNYELMRTGGYPSLMSSYVQSHALGRSPVDPGVERPAAGVFLEEGVERSEEPRAWERECSRGAGAWLLSPWEWFERSRPTRTSPAHRIRTGRAF
jgi:hypothetical protein